MVESAAGRRAHPQRPLGCSSGTRVPDHGLRDEAAAANGRGYEAVGPGTGRGAGAPGAGRKAAGGHGL